MKIGFIGLGKLGFPCAEVIATVFPLSKELQTNI